jgi:hypothetical protein
MCANIVNDEDVSLISADLARARYWKLEPSIYIESGQRKPALNENP